MNYPEMLSLTRSGIIVFAYIEKHGPTDKEIIAKAIDLSVSSVERGLREIREAGLSPALALKHDHVSHGHGHVEPAAPVTTGDPIRDELLGHGVLDWCVDELVAKVPQEQLRRQLDYHAQRLAGGFVFKTHPARYLFAACLHDYRPPAGFHETRYRERQNLPTRQEERRGAVGATAVPVTPPPAQMTREGAMTTIRLGMKSKLPHMRTEAERLALEWGVDLVALGG